MEFFEILRGTSGMKFEDLSIQYSTPKWIVDQWISEYGEEKAIQMLADQYRDKPTTIRVNLSKISRWSWLHVWKRKVRRCRLWKKQIARLPSVDMIICRALPCLSEKDFSRYRM